MKRRAYLAMAAAVGLSGCVAELESGSDPSDSRDEVSSAADADDTDDTTDAVESVESDNDSENDENEVDTDGEDDTEEPTEPDHPDIAGTFDDFEDLSKWSALEGSLSADDDRSTLGTQSAVLTSEKEDTRVTISREFSESMDLSAVVPGLALASDELISPRIRLFDAGDNRIDYRRPIAGGQAFQRYNFGVDEITDGVDLTEISEVQIILWTGEDTRRFWCDDLHFVPRPETGKVMIQFDDGFETDYTEGLPILQEYGYPAVTFINPGRIGNGNRLSLEQTEALAEAGWTISNHTDTHPHLSELEPSKQEAQIRDGKEWLIEHGFEDGARYFAYPFGDFDSTTVELVEKYHDLGFAGGPPAQGYGVNPQLCSRVGDPDADRAREILDWTVDMRGISSLFYHELEGELLADFEETIAYLHGLESKGKLEVILPSDLEERFLFP